MSSASSNKPQPPPNLRLQVGSTSATAASPGSSSSSPRAPRPAPNWASRCAACKSKHRNCTTRCLLAPYFPADQPSRFRNAQRLFGISKMEKTLQLVGPKYGPDAMRAIIFESEARAADPARGCVRIIQVLQRQLRDSEMELQFVREQIAVCRQASATDDALSDPADSVVAGQQDDHMVAVDATYANQQLSIPAGDLRDDPSSHQQQLYDDLCYNNGTAGDEAIMSDDWGMQQYGFVDDVVARSVKAAGSPAVALGEQLGQHCQKEACPFVDTFHVKQPQVLPATIQHHGPAAAAADMMQPQQKKLATPVLVNHDNVDE